MPATDSRSESPLSDIGSDNFTEEKFHRSRSPSNASDMSEVSEDSVSPSTSTPRNIDPRPAKRRRIAEEDHPTPRSFNPIAPLSPTGSVSSDSSGSVPTSPSFANLGPTHPLSTAYAAAQANPNDPESADYTQVTRCQWQDCPEPEQGNMDYLVNHINDAHIPPRQKKYFCEWEGCQRKSMPHTSAYALKAHMRSHTKEKPFMCQVPECDRSFTRSDALAKHMRTVHETEALRPSDPVPRGHTGGISQVDLKTNTNGNGNGNGNGNSLGLKLKLTFKGNKASSADASASIDPKVEGGIPALPTITTAIALGIQSPKPAYLEADEARDESLSRAVDIDSLRFTLPVDPSYYPPEISTDMEDYERDLPPSQWFRLLRRQIRWAQEEGKDLEKELGEMKGLTDNLRGNPVTRQASRDEEVGDQVRKDEWAVVDNLLDRVAHAEYAAALTRANKDMVDTIPLVPTHDAANVFQNIQTLPYWTRRATAVVTEPETTTTTMPDMAA